MDEGSIGVMKYWCVGAKVFDVWRSCDPSFFGSGFFGSGDCPFIASAFRVKAVERRDSCGLPKSAVATAHHHPAAHR